MDTLSADVVSQVEARIAEKIGPQRHKLWFKNTTHLHLADGFLKIGVPNMFIGSWIENHFSDVILEAATEISGEEPRLSFSIDPALSKNLKSGNWTLKFTSSRTIRSVRRGKIARALR